MTNAVESAAATILSTTKPTTTTAPASALNGPNVLQKNLDPPLDIVPTPGSPLPLGQVFLLKIHSLAIFNPYELGLSPLKTINSATNKSMIH